MLYDNGRYHMVYAGAKGESPRKTRFGLAVSENGSDWRRNKDLPVFSEAEEGRWDDFAVKNPSLLKVDDKYHMMYDGSSKEKGEWIGIGHAVSDDLESWSRVPRDPVLTLGEPGEWDSKSMADSYLTQIEGDYYLFYVGNDGEEWSIGYAKSEDLEQWEKHDSNPILTAKDVKKGAEGVLNPNVFKENGKYKMIYKVRAMHARDQKWIEYAEGNELDNLETFEQPILKPGHVHSWEGGGITNPEVIQTNDSYLMAYVGRVPSKLKSGPFLKMETG